MTVSCHIEWSNWKSLQLSGQTFCRIFVNGILYDYALLNRILQLSWKTLYRKQISIWGCDEKIFCCASNISFWWCALKNFSWLEFTTWWNDKYLNRCICSCWVNKSVSTPEINKTLKSSWLIYIKKKMILWGQVSCNMSIKKSHQKSTFAKTKAETKMWARPGMETRKTIAIFSSCHRPTSPGRRFWL